MKMFAWYILIKFCILTWHCLDTGMQNVDEAWPSINPSGCGQLVKMLITLEPHGIFYSNLFTYTY